MRAVWLLVVAISGAQAQVAAPKTFEAASVKPAPLDAHWDGGTFMLPISDSVPPRGLLTMTVPLRLVISFAYDIHDEVEIRAFAGRLPSWAQRQLFTIVARPPQDALSVEDWRAMIRNLLEERFALKAHREVHTAVVNRLRLIKAGVTGPDLHPHPPAAACEAQGTGTSGQGKEPGAPRLRPCGWESHLTAAGLLEISVVDVPMAQLAGQFSALGGLAGGRDMIPVVDGTGLAGHWDAVLAFRPETHGLSSGETPGDDGGGPTFTGALKEQLGLRLEKGSGPVEELIVDRISPPTPD